VDLHVQVLYSAIARPQGRGKVERLFGTITSELLPDLPGHLIAGVPASPPALTLAELDRAIGRWILNTYHQRTHRETRATPHERWIAEGWLPRTPASIEALDLLLVMVAVPRVVHRDGIRFQGLRYIDPVLAGYVGRSVTVRYDPRDITEIRVFLNNRFLCRAINPEHASETITLKDIQTARTKHRRALRAQLAAANSAICEYLPRNAPEHPTPTMRASPAAPAAAIEPAETGPALPPLYVYLEDKESDEHHRHSR
jgi:putative transposase